MRTKILCLNGIEGHQRAGYSHTKAQAIKGNLISFLKKVLSGTSDFGSINGENKQYFASFLKGRKTIPKGYVTFYLDLLLVEDHPIPPRSSLADLFAVWQNKTDLKACFRSYYESGSVIITSNSFWTIFYRSIARFSPEEVKSTFEILSFLGTPNNRYVWETFSARTIWIYAFGDEQVKSTNLIYLEQWKEFLLKFHDIRDFGLTLVKYVNEISPLNHKKRIFLKRILPIFVSNDYTNFYGFTGLLNSKYFSEEPCSTIIAGFIHFLINMFAPSPMEQNATINLFIETLSYFERFVLSDNSYFTVLFLKSLIKDVKSLTLKNLRCFSLVIYKESLITFYIISKYREKIVNPLTETINKAFPHYCDFHERLFILMFVKYEIPWYFVRNLHNLSDYELDIMFRVLQGENLKALIKNSIPVTNRQIHTFINYPRSLVIECNSVLLTGLFWSGFDSFCFDSKIESDLRHFFGLKFSNSDEKFIDDYEFINDVFSFFKRNELSVDNLDINPLLDYFFHRRYHYDRTTNFQINKTSLKNMLKEVEEWHVQMYLLDEYGFKTLNINWPGLRINNFSIKLSNDIFSIVQITSGEELYKEGKSMHHCVFSYIDKCVEGKSSIWSLRHERGTNITRLATIEVCQNKIVQVRKKTNHLPGKLENMVIEEWAESAGLKFNCQN